MRYLQAGKHGYICVRRKLAAIYIPLGILVGVDFDLHYV
jgi:hypothetical protein